MNGCTENWSLYQPINKTLINNPISRALQSTSLSLYWQEIKSPITYPDTDDNIQSKEYLTQDVMRKDWLHVTNCIAYYRKKITGR